ncbi:uncharacterized protein BJ171DRAFT_510320 [Polychytrium aggregatum]|uniref:uncharacterized protein n=1 Tax=Polychytrium aggregatum TaxID=110093 RepID=UPI0022FE73B7|nr:uncharacterized protein BJ171DRAFT_510320 [Polychytrium aggregatum]KAI9203309.1 hypothetical protein BJ171DRAFT_510320 [Polychytrium aggregatum]
MIACVSPLEDDYEETLNTLKYAYRARRIQNKPIINQLQEESSKIQDMQSKIDQLESMMKAYSSESTEGTGPAIAPAAEGDPGHPKIRALRPASATEELDDLDNESWMAVFVQEAKKRTSKAARAYRELIAARRTIQDERARTRQLEEHLMKLKAEQADMQFQLESLATEHNRLSDQMSAINAELEELIDPLDVVLRGMLWDDEQQDIVVRFLTHRRPSAYGTATAHDGTDLEHRSVRRSPRPQTHLAGSPAPTVLRTRHSSAHQRDEECEKQKLEVLRLEDELLESSKVIKSLKDEIQVLKMQFIAEETLCQARSTMLEKMERRNKEQRLEIDALRDRVAQLESLDRSLERQFDVRRPKTMASINYRDERGLRMQMGDPDDARLSEDQLRSIADQRSSRAESRHDVEDAEGAESVGGQAKTMAASAGFRAETASVGVDADQAGEDPDNDSQRELNIAMKAKVDAVKDLSRMGKEMDKLKSQFTEKSMRLEKHIEALSRDNAKLDKDLADLEQIKERQKDEYERKIKQLETQIYKLRNKKKEGDRLSKDKESLEKRISDLQQEVERAGSSHSLLKKKLKDDQDKLSDMEQRLGKETAALNKQHEDDMKKIRHLEVQYEMCRKKLDRKTEEIAVLVKKIKDGALMGGTKPREKFAATVADGSSPVPPKEGGGNQEPPANMTETANKSIKLSDADVEELRRDLGHLNGSKELIASLSDQPECDRIKAWTAFVSRVTKSPENAESTTQTESWAEIFEIPFAAIQKDLYFYRQTSKDLKAKLREVVAINQRLTGAPEHTKSISAAC